MNSLKVFVYGTLKPGEANYQHYCAGKVIEEQSAIAFGQLYDLPLGYPAMTPGERPVHGFLLTFADPSVLTALDDLEDYNPNRSPQENEYERQQIEIYSLSAQSLGLAWVYLMNPERIHCIGGVLLRSGWWSSKVPLKTNAIAKNQEERLAQPNNDGDAISQAVG